MVLIYDLYPELLVEFAGLSKHNIIARFWWSLNKLAYERADIVFTIGEHMARRLETTYDPPQTKAGRTVVIPNWADPDIIRPLDKEGNWFAQKYDQVNKITVLYSGTIGLKHNISPMVDAAVRLRYLEDVNFVFIG